MSFGQLKPIIGGQGVENHDYPFVVYLSIETQPSWHAVCGGTLISDRHIVTAAHCLIHAHAPQAIRIGYGSTHVHRQTSIRAANFTVHPQFNPRTLFNDIAIIELPASNRIRATGVAHRIPIYFGPVEPGMTVTTMGWGITSNSPGARTVAVMNRVDLNVALDSECRRVDRAFASSNGPFVCTGTADRQGGSRDQCNGDSGSPAVVSMGTIDGRKTRRGRWWRWRWRARKHARGSHGDLRLVALTSYGDNIRHDEHPACGDPSGFGFSTHVAHYEEFITQVTGLTRVQLEQPAFSDRQVSK
ncbi:Kallikrein-14 [Coemansia erecta]|nr:Kallikrein-14 [Coemansia erecta]